MSTELAMWVFATKKSGIIPVKTYASCKELISCGINEDQTIACLFSFRSSHKFYRYSRLKQTFIYIAEHFLASIFFCSFPLLIADRSSFGCKQTTRVFQFYLWFVEFLTRESSTWGLWPTPHDHYGTSRLQPVGHQLPNTAGLRRPLAAEFDSVVRGWWLVEDADRYLNKDRNTSSYCDVTNTTDYNISVWSCNMPVSSIRSKLWGRLLGSSPGYIE